MNSFKLLTIVILFFLSHLNLFASTDCSHSKDELGILWTKQYRSQQGEWIWFLGKGKSDLKEIAMFKAEGDALDKLSKECQQIHQNVKFHERCIDKKSGVFTAYARASVKYDHCESTKTNNKNIINKKLTLDLENYRKKYISILLEEGCNSKDFSFCAEKASFNYIRGDLKKAKALAVNGCEYRDGQSCLVLAEFIHSQRDQKYTEIIKLACDYLGDDICFQKIQKYKKNNRGLYSDYISLLCNMGNSVACYEFSLSKSDVDFKLLDKSCNLNYVKACRYLETYYQKKNIIKSEIYTNKICKILGAESCKLKKRNEDVESLEEEFGEEAIKQLEI